MNSLIFIGGLFTIGYFVYDNMKKPDVDASIVVPVIPPPVPVVDPPNPFDNQPYIDPPDPIDPPVLYTSPETHPPPDTAPPPLWWLRSKVTPAEVQSALDAGQHLPYNMTIDQAYAILGS